MDLKPQHNHIHIICSFGCSQALLFTSTHLLLVRHCPTKIAYPDKLSSSGFKVIKLRFFYHFGCGVFLQSEQRIAKNCITSYFNWHFLLNLFGLSHVGSFKILQKGPKTSIDYAWCCSITEPFCKINSLQEETLCQREAKRDNEEMEKTGAMRLTSLITIWCRVPRTAISDMAKWRMLSSKILPDG